MRTNGSDERVDRGAEEGLPGALAPFPLLRLDPTGVVLSSNGRLERELGLDVESLVGMRFHDLADEARERIDGLLRGGRARVRLRTPAGPVERGFDAAKQGETVWLIGNRASSEAERGALQQAHLRAEAQADEYARISVQLQRANEQLTARAAEIREATAAKSRFLHTMSHELRTPLNAVLGYAGLLRDGVYGQVPARQLDAVQAIVRRARDLQLLIDDVLDLSRMEAGRLELRTDDFDPGEVLEEVRHVVGAAAGEKELAVSVRYDLRARVRLDRAKYRQMLTHLASNAVKFTPRRGEIELSVRSGEDNTFVTTVRDTGIGIPEEQIASIFVNFQQLESGNTRRYPGIGLGLSLVQRLVHLMGGTIEVRSAPGAGSTFAVTLPLALHAAGPADDDLDVDAIRSGAPVLLAIDDDPEVIRLLRDSVATEGYQVVGATSGDRGLELARMLRPFAITLDIMMPEKDGWQVLRELKADDELRDVPVVIMSIVAERAMGFSLGVTEYLVKPVERSVLLDVLGRLRRNGRGRDVLVVDDDPDTRRLLGDLLGNLGYLARFARDSQEALEQLDAKPPEYVILDVTLAHEEVSRIMSRLSGDDRLREVRTVVITRSDVEHSESWRALASAAVAIQGNEEPDALRRVLREALAEAPVSADEGAAT